MADRVAGPGDPVLQLARDDLEQLGLGADLVVVQTREARVVDGAADALTPSELAWIGHGEVDGGTSLGLDSKHVFAWRPLDTDTEHALVTVVNRRALSGDLTSGRMLFAFLALVAAVLGLATAHFLALDVSDHDRAAAQPRRPHRLGRPHAGRARRVRGRARATWRTPSSACPARCAPRSAAWPRRRTASKRRRPRWPRWAARSARRPPTRAAPSSTRANRSARSTARWRASPTRRRRCRATSRRRAARCSSSAPPARS